MSLLLLPLENCLSAFVQLAFRGYYVLLTLSESDPTASSFILGSECVFEIWQHSHLGLNVLPVSVPSGEGSDACGDPAILWLSGQGSAIYTDCSHSLTLTHTGPVVEACPISICRNHGVPVPCLTIWPLGTLLMPMSGPVFLLTMSVLSLLHCLK